MVHGEVPRDDAGERRRARVLLRGKVWPRGEKEPASWTIEAVDETPNLVGSPGFYGDATNAEIYIDNVSVTPNDTAQVQRVPSRPPQKHNNSRREENFQTILESCYETDVPASGLCLRVCAAGCSGRSALNAERTLARPRQRGNGEGAAAKESSQEAAARKVRPARGPDDSEDDLRCQGGRR